MSVSGIFHTTAGRPWPPPVPQYEETETCPEYNVCSEEGAAWEPLILRAVDFIYDIGILVLLSHDNHKTAAERTHDAERAQC
mmetsp:Transcript_18664/g.25978  ORF Transcript_18664/g.25978 Transcript_18664/m.25978 type:complete len:82 (+) Transcript_18664:195-440(+)